MKKFMIVCVALAGGFAMLGSASTAEAGGVNFSLNLGNGYGYSNYGNFRGRYRSYNARPYYHGRRHSYWHDTSHYDYHPGGFYRHRNHYHYQPGHYDYHQSGHWDHH
ncbi:hypothetical protein [Gimesia chilikensis]|uniref:hypothetical protein n=1 Tax=Gimesia chilikensis TaxID=2605989 RepID=UPI0018E0A0E9|nr:hypothetical protein [Gimesia chilikensis]